MRQRREEIDTVNTEICTYAVGWLTLSFYFKEEGNLKTFYLQQLSTFQAVKFDASLIKINWKIRKFLKFENILTGLMSVSY